MGKLREKNNISSCPGSRECGAQDSRGLGDIFFHRLNGSAVLSSRIHLADSFQDARAVYSGSGSR